MQIGGREAVLGFSGELRRRAPPRAGRSPHRPHLHAIGAVRSARTTQIKRRGVPLRRTTVDRWTGSTGAVHRWRQQLCHRLRQLRVSVASASQSQLATWRHRSLSAGRPGNFAKRTPSFQNSQIYPSTYIKPFN
jgi:hypothetical protein